MYASAFRQLEKAESISPDDKELKKARKNLEQSLSKDKEKIYSMTYKAVSDRIDKENEEMVDAIVKGALVGSAVITAGSTYTTAMLAYSAGNAISKGLSAIQNVFNTSGDISVGSLSLGLYDMLKK